MSIANLPNARVLLIHADGTLMEGCCCVSCTGSCCCDTNVEAWFQEPLTITITSVREATPDDPTLPSLQCLVGTWVLPYKSSGVGSPRCSWENTFNPTNIEDGVAFKITASSPLSLDGSMNPTQTACLSVTIQVLSCKDCNGEVMNQTPDIIFDNSSANCSHSYSPSMADIGNCGCGTGSVNKIIDGSWNSSLAGVDVGLLTDIQEYGFYGQCWYHPDAQDRTALLYLSNARIMTALDVDVTSDFESAIDELDVTIGYSKDSSIPGTPCQYVPDGPPVSGFDENLVPSTSVAPDEYCGWAVTLKRPYTDMSAIAVEGATSYVSYYTTHTFSAGCEGQDPVFIRLGEFVFASVTYYIEVQIQVKLSGPSSCAFYLGANTSGTNCSLNTSTNYCDVLASTCGDQIATYTIREVGFPTIEVPSSNPGDGDIIGPDDVGTGGHVGISDNGSINFGDDCACPEAMLEVCTAYDMVVNLPAVIKADDYAPAGARYEIICRVANEEGDPTDYHFVYTKSLGADESVPSDYPKGVWKLDWAPPAEVFSRSWCGCAAYAAGVITSAKERIQVLAGAVPDSTLFGPGIAGLTGTDGDPFVHRVITVYERPTYGIDPCCDCSSNKCSQRHCNNCACDGESSANPPGAPDPCSRNLHQREISDYCCPCAAETSAELIVSIEQVGVCPGNAGESFQWEYLGVLNCNVALDTSLNPPTTGPFSGTDEVHWDCGGKCTYSYTVTASIPDDCGIIVAPPSTPAAPACAAYNCSKQRWEGPAHNVHNSDPPVEVNLTSCTGSRTSTQETTAGGFSEIDTLTENFTNHPGCSSNGHGTVSLIPDDDCTSHSFDYNCVATSAEGYWRYRRILPIDDANGMLTSVNPVARFFYFPGNGDSSCSSLNGTMSIAEMGDNWADDSDPDRTVYLYTTFMFSVSSDGRCGGSTEPLGLIDVVCPTDIGILVDVSMNGSVTETYDADCLNPDCMSPFYSPP